MSTPTTIAGPGGDMTLVLSLFPGIGLLDMAFEEQGFCVVRGPDQLWGGDIHRFHPPPGVFDGIIGGPPCQCFSRLRHMVEHNGYQVAPNLIPEFQRCVYEAQPRWFVMENVPEAPAPFIPGYAVSSIVMNNRWFGGVQHRERRINLGVRGEQPVSLVRWLEVEAFESPDWEPAVLASGARQQPIKIGGSGKVKRLNKTSASHRTLADAIRLQGLPEDFLKHSPLTIKGQQKMVGNGVPLPLGQAIARSVKAMLGIWTEANQ